MERKKINSLRNEFTLINKGKLDFDYDLIDNFINISNQKIISTDFYDCDFRYANFTICNFLDMKVVNSNFSFSKFYGSKIHNTTFHSSIFKDTAFIFNKGIVCEMLNVIFENCIFESLALDFTYFQNCQFINCKIKKTDFNGSRFENVTFSGIISDSFFRHKIKHPPQYSIVDKLFRKSNITKEYVNEMKQIDFSNCELSGVTFADGLNLKSCSFPISDRYLFINDSEKTFSKAQNYINEKWTGEYKRLANIVFSSFFFSKYKGENQIHDFIDFNIIKEQIGDDFSEQLKIVIKLFNS